METTHTLALRIDSDLNIVCRILDLLVTLDAHLPDLSLATTGDAELVISKLSISADRLAVLRRRVAAIPGVRSVTTS